MTDSRGRAPVPWHAGGSAGRVPLHAALRVGLIYVVVSALWITLSDRALGLLVSDPSHLTLLQTYKGLGFVMGSGLLLVVLVLRELRETRRSEDRFRSLVEQTLIGVWVVRGGRFLYVNPRLAEIFGHSQEEMMSTVSVADTVAPESRAEVLEWLRQGEEGEVPVLRYQFRGRRRDGREVRAEVFGRRIDLEGFPALIGVLLDRTEETKLEEQLHRAERMEAIGQLTGSVAHDFNNLLTAIIAPLDLLLGEMPRDARFRAEIREVRETAERATVLTRQLLAFSRKQLDRPRVVDPAEELRKLEPMLNRLLPERITFQVAPASLAYNIRIDPASLEQVVVNLVVNARDAIEFRGEITVTVREVDGASGELRRRDGQEPGPHVCLEVRDTGQGMDEETRLRIFEPFFTTKAGGTGLGLATVFGRVTKAGGFVRVRSSPCRGSAFQVFLPAVTEAVEERAVKVRSARGLTGKERILLAEDDDRVRTVTAAALERFGYSVAAVGSVQDALDLAAGPRGGMDLIVTDLNLPDGTGTELARALVTRCAGARVLFMSGYSDEEAIGSMEELDGALFLAKPFSLESLLRKVEEALRGPVPRVREGRG